MRVLIVRTSALGDVVHCLPVLSALRRHLPAAKIGWVVEEAFAPLLTGHPLLDEVLPVRLRPWRRAPFSRRTLSESTGFAGTLRRFGADVALDLMGNHKAGVLCRLSGAPRRIGLAGSLRREPSSAIWLNERLAEGGREHAVDRALAVLAALALPTEPADFRGDLLPAAALPADSTPFVLIHAGAGWGNKIYPADRWGAVAREIAQQTGLAIRVGLSPNPSERDLAAAIVAASRGVATPLEAGDLLTLTAQLRRAQLVLGGDTGPIHLAHALGTPVLAVMGPTNPVRHGPYGAPERALAQHLPCSFCYRRFQGTKACLLALPPGEVARRALHLLAAPRHGMPQ